ncbi:12896_t:CDS:2, partial [Acaulospora morrowiae]
TRMNYQPANKIQKNHGVSTSTLRESWNGDVSSITMPGGKFLHSVTDIDQMFNKESAQKKNFVTH